MKMEKIVRKVYGVRVLAQPQHHQVNVKFSLVTDFAADLKLTTPRVLAEEIVVVAKTVVAQPLPPPQLPLVHKVQ